MGFWGESIAGRHPAGLAAGDAIPVGVLRGEGVGPEVVGAASEVLVAVCEAAGRNLRLDVGPDPASPSGGLTDEVNEFCRRTFAGGGAIFTGPHGGRWVYEVRKSFDLFCKISPLVPSPEIAPDAAPSWPDRLRGVDVLVVREQAAGVYQGRWSETDVRREGHVAEHSFSYSAREVRRIMETAVALARERRCQLTVVVKRGGVPSISGLWMAVAKEAAEGSGVELRVDDIDYAVYGLIRDPSAYDVVVAPNLFGDVLADAGGLLLGSRGLCFGASFDAGLAAVYQTNHGSAHDLAGSDRANPGAQILAAAAMLRESFALAPEADAIEGALAATWRAGFRTDDLAEAGCETVGTAAFGEQVAQRVQAALRAGRAEPAPPQR